MTKEAFRMFNFNKQTNQSEIWAITSGRRGVGKTTLAVNLAILLRQLEKRVLLIDADAHLGNVDKLLGLHPKFTFLDVVNDSTALDEAMIEGPAGIKILPNSSTMTDQLFEEEHFLEKLDALFKLLNGLYDIILVDTGSSISPNVLSFVFQADKVLLLVCPDPASIADAYALVKVVKKNQEEKPVIMVSNMVTSEEEGELLYKKMSLITKGYLQCELIFGGAILVDQEITMAARSHRPFVLDHPASYPTNTMRVMIRKLLRQLSEVTPECKPFYQRFFYEPNQKVLGK